MAVHSYGHLPGLSSTDSETELFLFVSNLSFILERRDDILQKRDYFFCSPSFSWCSWPYLGGDGPLPLGFLLTGWRDGWLTETCPECSSTVYLICFGGSPLSGSNGWTGICSGCPGVKSTRGASPDSFRARLVSVIHLRKSFPAALVEWQEYDGYEFCWGGAGLKPAKKKRLVRHLTAEPVVLETLLEDLSRGSLRQCGPPVVCLLRSEARLKYSRRQERS